MTSMANPSRRDLMKWGISSAGIPIVSRALGPAAEGNAIPDDKGERGGSVVNVRPGLEIYYKEEWLGAPWMDAEPALFLHGNLETSEIWYGWVPRMAQQLRVFRPDLPGFGRSTVPPNFEWSLENYAKAIVDFMDSLGIQSAHIIGAKTGGAIAMQLAATYPQRTRTLVVASGPFTAVDPRMESASQQVRLGSAASKEEIAYFDKMRDATGAETRRGMGKVISGINLESLLPRITARALIITTDRSALQSVETVLHYQQKIPNSSLLVLSSDAYHVAVAKADDCVTNVLAFIKEKKQMV